MSPSTSSPEPLSLLAVLLDLRGRRATGALEVESAGQRRRLCLVGGELYLPGAHPLARRVAERLTARDQRHAATVAPGDPLFEPLQRIGEAMAEWRPERSTFHAGLAALPSDLIGPLPTWHVLGVVATAGLDDAEVQRRLGDPARRVVAAALARDSSGSGAPPEEALLLERLRIPMSVGEVLEASPVPRAVLARHLARLIALGAVCSAEGGGGPEPEPARDFVARIAERIERGLAERPVTLPVEEHRKRATDLLARHGGLDHYELLGVSPAAGIDEIQAAFEELARLAHPSNAGRLGLAAGERALRILFEAATSAYETLLDPERRRLYNQRELIDLPAGGPTGERREAERRGLARSTFERAQAYAVAGDNHSAIQLLEQVVRTDPRAEYWAALARLEARNPSWTDRALASYRAAIQLDPDNADIRFGAGQLFEQLGDLDRARTQYGAALRLRPGHLEASARMSEIASSRAPKRAGRGWSLSRLFRRG